MKGEDGWRGGKAREIMSCGVCDLRSNKTQNRDLMGQKEKDGELEGGAGERLDGIKLANAEKTPGSFPPRPSVC